MAGILLMIMVRRTVLVLLLLGGALAPLWGQAPRPKGEIFHRTVKDFVGTPRARLDVDSTSVEMQAGSQILTMDRTLFNMIVDEYIDTLRHDSARKAPEFSIGQQGRDLILSFRQPAWLAGLVGLLGVLGLLGALLLRRVQRRFQQLHTERAQLLARRRLVEAGQEQERQRLARELHDGPLQTLYALRMQMARQDPDLNHQDTMVESISTHLRDLLGTLRSPLLAPYGLKDALRTLEATYPHTQFDLDIDAAVEATLSMETRNTLFRIAQEAISNAVRHGQASEIRAALYTQGAQVHLVLEDNGSGFDTTVPVETYSKAGHYGLVGMRERIDVLGGVLHLQSSDGGTLVRISLPYSGKSTLPGGETSRKVAASSFEG